MTSVLKIGLSFYLENHGDRKADLTVTVRSGNLIPKLLFTLKTDFTVLTQGKSK
jgi:hypothetical protein